jgi:hypothetical protein
MVRAGTYPRTPGLAGNHYSARIIKRTKIPGVVAEAIYGWPRHSLRVRTRALAGFFRFRIREGTCPNVPEMDR